MNQIKIPPQYQKNRLIQRASEAQKRDLLQWFQHLTIRPTLKAIRENKEKIENWINNHYDRPNTRAHHLTTLRGLLVRARTRKKELLPITKQCKEEKEAYLAEKKDNEPSEEYLDYLSICKFRDHYEEVDHWKWLTLCLYTFWPPIRSEWFHCRVGKGSENENYIYQDGLSWRLKINHDKLIHGKSSKEPVEFDLHDPLVQRITGGNISIILMKSLEQFPREYVLPKFDDLKQPMGDTYRHYLHRIFNGRQVGINILRQAFVSNLRSQEITSNERDHLASLMRHSTKVADEIYHKLGSTVEWTDATLKEMKDAMNIPKAYKTAETKRRYVEKNREKIYCNKLLKHCNYKGIDPRPESIRKYGLVRQEGQWVQAFSI